MRQLIVNADDLGLTPGVNSGIFDAHRGGILTSASLMAGAAFVEDAIARARSYPSLGLGCHLTLVDGRPVSRPSSIPTLVDGQGRFRPSWKPFILDTVLGRVSMRDVEHELTAQIDRLVTAGVRITHLDSHKHVHAHPAVFSIVLRLARRYGVPSVRIPFETLSPRVLLSSAGATNLAMCPWAALDRRRARKSGLLAPAFTGRSLTGTLTQPALVDLIRRLPPGVTELMVHPGHVDPDLQALPTRLLESRAIEVAALCAQETRTAIRERGVTLVRHDLVPVAATEDSGAS